MYYIKTESGKRELLWLCIRVSPKRGTANLHYFAIHKMSHAFLSLDKTHSVVNSGGGATGPLNFDRLMFLKLVLCQNASKERSQDNWVSLSSFDSVGNMKYGHFQFRVFFREFKVKELAFVVIRTLLPESPARGGGGGTHAPPNFGWYVP